MYSRIFTTGKTFRAACQYVAEDLDRAKILEVEGVRGHDVELMADDFNQQHQFRLSKERPVFHGLLSFPDGERPNDSKLVEIAREYLRKIDMPNTQYVIVKHTDTSHLHLHIVANKVDNEGKIIGRGLIAKRGMKAAQELTRKYHLTHDRGKNIELTNFDALREPDIKRYQIYQTIQKHLPGCESFADLEKRLLRESITMRFRKDPISDEIQGISFRKGKWNFAGRKVDPSCSYKNLQQTLVQRLELRQEEELKLENRQEQRLRIRHSL